MFATDNTTFINGIGIAFCLLMCVLMLVLPRRLALLPVIAMVCYMTMGQRVLVFGLNFTLIRILLLFGFVRVVIRSEASLENLNRIDKILLGWVLSSVVTYTLLWKTGDAFVNRLGLAYDAIGLYFLFRFLVRDADDIRSVIVQFAWLTLPLAACMLIEKRTGQNPFGALGGVPPETLVREGVLRCQGPFAHPILAGTFGSTLLPLFVGLFWQRRHRLLAVAAVICAATIVICAASSGPVGAAIAGLLGLVMWGMRDHMRAVRWTMGLCLVSLHLAMAAPVWFLLSRVGIFGGSTAYHRAILIDNAVHRFPEWWLLGTYSTSHWGYQMFDVTNQYVLQGVQGGIVTMVLFIAVIARCFGAVGHAAGSESKAVRNDKILAWSLGASLLVHAINYISVVYFDQNMVNWYLLLAMIATLGISQKVPSERAEGDVGMNLEQSKSVYIGGRMEHISRLPGVNCMSAGKQ